MLEEIEYWNSNSWKEFVRSHVVLLRDYAKATADTLEVDPIGREASKIAEVAEQVVRIAEDLFGEGLGKVEEVPEDALEVARLFLETGLNLTAGHNPRTFFVWSLRKVAKLYAEEHYPKLKDPEKFDNIRRVLGLRTYWKPPAVKSEVVAGYEVYGYPDYLSLLDIHKEESYEYHFRVASLPGAQRTLGGLLCELNELLWDLARKKPGLAAGYEMPNVFDNYKATAESMLSKALWKDERAFLLSVNMSTEGSEKWLYEFEGLGIKKLYRGYNWEERGKLSILEFWDLLMPPHFLGRFEFVLTEDKGRGALFRRW